ncbi:hypothetical protein POTOM_039691 [Populus tomentosa]|uniref:Uncharacterized protein n=1 Tax=Populus tomentosa TaxID=118781 RepID=A0A8X7YSF2_POPTO|nr:hypothetical protein POTOM_039691 [Populus tomentosa]
MGAHLRSRSSCCLSCGGCSTKQEEQKQGCRKLKRHETRFESSLAVVGGFFKGPQVLNWKGYCREVWIVESLDRVDEQIACFCGGHAMRANEIIEVPI